MQLLHLKSTDIYFNLAVEEYLLKEKNEDYFIIWQSENALVFGKHQNVFEEISLAYTLENKINIARRISGGGTVFHDLGNVNFSLILNKTEGKQIDFDQHTKPIYEFLKSLNLNVKYSDRHDLFIDNKKISGNAEHVFKNRVLHHGTLLFNSDLNQLQKSLIISKNKFNSKSIKSVSSNVANISNYTDLSLEDFISNLKTFVSSYFNIKHETNLQKEEMSEIKKLRDNKYKNNYWIIDYSPKFNFKNSFNNYTIELKVERGTIENFKFSPDTENIKEIFIKQKYYPETILKLITSNNLGEKLGMENKDLLLNFF